MKFNGVAVDKAEVELPTTVSLPSQLSAFNLKSVRVRSMILSSALKDKTAKDNFEDGVKKAWLSQNIGMGLIKNKLAYENLQILIKSVIGCVHEEFTSKYACNVC